MAAPSLRAFSTVFHSSDEPVWTPLEAVARLARRSPDMPSFHPMEFMWMYSERNAARGVIIHAYKHIDTCCYLHLDEAGNAYEFLGGRYRQHRSLYRAVSEVGFSDFDADPPLYRSYPPERWPPDDDGEAA